MPTTLWPEMHWLDKAKSKFIHLQVEHKRLVRKSWSEAISENLGGPAPVATLIEEFYGSFFALSPEAKLLFKTDPMHQTKVRNTTMSPLSISDL